MRELKIAYGSSCFAKVWSNKTITFDALCERLKNTIRTPETVEEYPKLSKAERDRAKDKGGMVGGWLKQGRRKAANVECRSMLTHDIDSADPGFLERYRMLNQYASCLYSTHSHTPEAPRYRIITPLTRDVSPEEYLALTRLLAKEWGIDCVDSCSYRAHQLMYWPTTPSNGEYVFERFDGPWLDPDAFLSAHPGWRDVSLLPTSSRESTLIDHQRKQQADPLAKPGIVGAFCRTYSIEEAIDTFLSDVYQPSAMAGRYDYVPADSSAGVVLYDGKFAYSHHATDPACGQLLNAFDLVRIHKFRDLDDKTAADTAPSKLPSYKAMCDFAVQDDGVKKTLAEDRAAQAQEDFKEDDNWQAQLDLERNGTIKDTMANISAILRHDPNLQGIVYNQFSNLLDVREALPWQQVKPGWSDTDLACAKLYFERCYGIWSPTKFKDALLAVTSAERLYHPVRDYLESLVWDGMPRLDTLLIDYLGADDTPYVRAATRKTLTAGVARIYEPGVKFDSILVLNGPQGIGKSTFFARLGKKWYSDSLTIADMKDKTAPEKLQGYWLLEISELAGMKKMDVETVKSFITRTDDKYRQSYGVSVESHPRSCIIVGTTNSDGGFLRDITGNRRFWPVRVSGSSILHPWDMKDIDQIWAEAVCAYRNGEELFLKDDVAAEAYAQQREAMESDDREGVVQDYLDRLLPADWDKYDLYQRRSYFGGSDFGTPAEGTVRRDRVCAMEIWCECFGKAREALKKADSYEIEGILYKLGGWKKYEGSSSGKARFIGYGVQKCYVRVSDVETETGTD